MATDGSAGNALRRAGTRFPERRLIQRSRTNGPAPRSTLNRPNDDPAERLAETLRRGYGEIWAELDRAAEAVPVLGGRIAGGEPSGGLQDHIDAHVLPRELLGVGLAQDLEVVVPAADGVAVRHP